MYRGRQEVQQPDNKEESGISGNFKEDEEVVKLLSPHIDAPNSIQSFDNALTASYAYDIILAVKQVFPNVPEKILQLFVKEVLNTYANNKKYLEYLKDYSKKVMEDISESGRTRVQAQKNFIEILNSEMDLEGKVPEILKKWVEVFTKKEENKTYPTININIKQSSGYKPDDYIEIKLDDE